jgi:glycosyltransferase involved in cell wall biosynthesis
MSTLHDITPVILTMDEEANIGRALDSLRWADRIVILDSGSTDRTEGIARSYGSVDWQVRSFDNHHAQWEFAIRHTGIPTDYVMALDADMQVTPPLLEEIRNQFLGGDFSGGFIPFEYQYYGRSLAGSLCPPQMRLFRTDEVSIDQPDHTQRFTVRGSIYRFRQCLIHDDRKSLEQWAAAQLAYQRLNQAALAGEGRTRLRDRLRRMGLMPPLAWLLAYLRAGGPFGGAVAARYAYERSVTEGLLAIRLLNERLQGSGTEHEGCDDACQPLVDNHGVERVETGLYELKPVKRD